MKGNILQKGKSIQAVSQILIFIIFIAISTKTLFAQDLDGSIVYLDSINDVIELDMKWKYKQGDDLSWAAVDVDDSKWDSLYTILNLDSIDDKTFTGKAWFRIHLNIDPYLLNEPYAILMDQRGVSEIYLNGEKIETLGTFATDSSDEERYNPKLLPTVFQFKDTMHQVIAVRYSHEDAKKYRKRYYSRIAGFSASITDYKIAITQVKYFIVSINIFLGLIMIFSILGFIHLLLYIFYRKKISNLYYSVFMFIFSLLVYGGMLQNTVSLNPDVQTKVGFFISLILPIFFISLLGLSYSLFYKKPPKLFWIGSVLGLLIAIGYFLNLTFINYVLFGFAVLIPVEIIRVVIIALIKKKDGAWIIGSGVILFIVFIVFILSVSFFIGNLNISPTGPLQYLLIFFIVLAILSIPLSMSIYLARDIAKTNVNLEKQLEQVKLLSAKTLAQEREKKRILEGQKEKLEYQVKERTKELEQEKEKTEELLLNTLPLKVVNDLKENGKTIPESFDDVTVYFSDIVGFTKLSTQMAPDALIEELNGIFTAFDDIMVSNQCERIKTIGDAYLAVCGMPEKNSDHASNMINAAVEIRNYLDDRNKSSDIEWKVRIGIHSGRVVGGVVGVRKYIYDVFGDTINTTSRMESNSEPMQINVSETTYNLVKDKFDFVARKPMEIKGKGRMRMYFLEGGI